MGLVLVGKEERPKCVRNPSDLRQKCVKNAQNTFGGEHLLDDTELRGAKISGKSKWGLSKWGLKVLVHNCPQLPTIVVILCDESSP